MAIDGCVGKCGLYAGWGMKVLSLVRKSAFSLGLSMAIVCYSR